MKPKKIPLEERLQLIKDGKCAYPEYYSAVISRQGEMPVSDYLSGLDAGVQARFQRLIPLSDSLTFQQAAQMIENLYESHSAMAAEAMRILAAPMMRYEDQLRAREALASASEDGERMAWVDLNWTPPPDLEDGEPLAEAGPDMDVDVDWTMFDLDWTPASASEDGEPMAEVDLETDLPDIMAATDEDEDSPSAMQKLPLAVRLRQVTMKLETVARLPIYGLYTPDFFLEIDEMLGGGSRYSDAFDEVLAPYVERYEAMPHLSRFVADSSELSYGEQTQLLYQTLIQPFTELQNKKERSNYQCISLPF